MPSKPVGAATDQNLSICVRIRPMSKEELKRNAMKVCYRVDDKLISMIDPADDSDYGFRYKRPRNREYTFDHAFDESCSQEDIFQATTASLVEHVANGYNATVFASGATGAGKTYTMVGTGEDPGIMVRAMDELLNFMVRTSDEYLYTIGMSYMELYNELLRDLLNPGPDYLELREDSKGVQVIGLTELEPSNRKEVFELLQRGNQNRSTEPTAANRTSSRSHAILQITVRQRSRVVDVNEEVHVGKLFLIDLAGSERASKTLNRGKRMTEGAHINRSLLALGNCINALADTNGKRYVNFRDSKLTRLLKEALAGNCRTVMIAHISPSSLHFEESYNTLAYANRAKSIKTKVRRNVIDVNHHISQYTQLIEELREEIARLKSNLTNASGSRPSDELNLQLNKLKETLLVAYQKHLNLRHELVSVRNRLLEVELEETRQSTELSDWECSRLTNCNVSASGDSQNNLQEVIPMDPVVTEIARKRWAAFQAERNELNATRERIETEHQEAAIQVNKLQSTLLLQTRRPEEREIIALLVRLHELELERADLNARYAISDTELKKRELLLDQLRQDNRLSDAIIRYQCTLLDFNKVDRPKELEHLLELYEHQGINNTDRRVSFTGSSMEFRSMLQAPIDGLHGKVSTSLSSLPTESGLDENRYNRTAKWLEHSEPRRASDVEAVHAFGLESNLETGQSAVQKPNGSKFDSNSRPSRLTGMTINSNTLNKNNKAISHPEIRTLLGSDDSNSSESETMRTLTTETATKSISAVAQQRKDQKLREKKQKLRNQNSLNQTTTNSNNNNYNPSMNQASSSMLSDIGENPESIASPRNSAIAPSPFPNDPDAWPTVAGSKIVIEPQRLPGRRPARPARDDRPDSSWNLPNGDTRNRISRCVLQPDTTQTDAGDRQPHPLTKAVKVTPMELRAQKIGTKTSKARTNEKKKPDNPRSRSTPRQVQQQSTSNGINKDSAFILQVPQLVRVSDHLGTEHSGTRSTKPLSRNMNTDLPLQQKTAVERRQLRVVNQTVDS